MCPGSLALAPFSLSSCVGFRSCRSVLFKFRQNRNYPQVCPWIKKRSGRQDVNDLLHVKKGSFAASVGVTYGIWSVGRKVSAPKTPGCPLGIEGRVRKTLCARSATFLCGNIFLGLIMQKQSGKGACSMKLLHPPQGVFPFQASSPKGSQTHRANVFSRFLGQATFVHW